MGKAFTKGLVTFKVFDADVFMVSTPHPEKCADLSEIGIKVTDSNIEAVKQADVVVIAVKPGILQRVVSEIKDYLEPDTEVTAIVAGVGADEFTRMWGHNSPGSLSISMPNTAMSILESTTFFVPLCGDSEKTLNVLAHVGETFIIPENQLGAATALASCGIAYAMRYIRAACEGGVELGFNPAMAQKIVTQTVKGAASLLCEDGAHPETEIDKVTTPGGLTIRGLNEMEKNGFSAAVISGLKASVK